MPVNFNLLARQGPANFAEGLMQGQEQQNALFQQQQQRQLGDIQLRNALRAEQEALAESEAARGSTSLEDLAKRQRQAGLGKQALATEAALGKQRTDKASAAKTQLELMKASAGQIMANPESAVQVLTRFGQMTGMDMSDDIAQIQGKDPETVRNWAASHALGADKLFENLRVQNEAAQLRPKPSPVGMPTETPAPAGNALGTPVAGVSNAMVAQPAPAPAPAATTFAAGRLARVEQEIGQMQDVLSRSPENKLASDRLKAAVEERDKLITQDRAAKQLEKPEIKQNSEGNYVAINPSTLETKVITGSDGKPVRSLDAAVKAETERHNKEIEGQGRTKISQEDRRLSQENKRIKLAEEAAARAADPEFQRKMEAAKQMGTAMGKDAALRITMLPKVLDTAEMALNEVDALIGKRDAQGNLLKGQKPHPGFETAVGATLLPGARFVPGTSASDFQARFDQIKGGAFLQAFETLKGGGQITNVEGEKATAALNRMNLAQSEAEFITAAREFQDIVRKGVERAKKLAGSSAAPAASEIPDLPPPGAVRRKP
jgi:hypothetical protein